MGVDRLSHASAEHLPLLSGARDAESEQRQDRRWTTAVRGWLLLALTLGLAASISLSQLTLVALAAWLAFGPRRAGARHAGWPLAGPLAAFAAWTLVAVLASPRPLESLVAAKGLLALGAFYVVRYA